MYTTYLRHATGLSDSQSNAPLSRWWTVEAAKTHSRSTKKEPRHVSDCHNLSNRPSIYSHSVPIAVSPKAPQKGSSKKGKSLLITPEDSPDARSVIPPLAPVQPQTSVDLPHLFGKSPYNCFIWRVVPLKYASYSFPTNPGLLALSRSGYGGVFVVRSPMWESCCAMEILHIPTLRQYELSRTIQKLRVLRRIREDPQASRFVLQPSAGVGHSIWYSSHLYLHIVTVSDLSRGTITTANIFLSGFLSSNIPRCTRSF